MLPQNSEPMPSIRPLSFTEVGPCSVVKKGHRESIITPPAIIARLGHGPGEGAERPLTTCDMTRDRASVRGSRPGKEPASRRCSGYPPSTLSSGHRVTILQPHTLVSDARPGHTAGEGGANASSPPRATVLTPSSTELPDGTRGGKAVRCLPASVVRGASGGCGRGHRAVGAAHAAGRPSPARSARRASRARRPRAWRRA